MEKSIVLCLSVLIIACWLREGLGLADFTNPPSGSVIPDFEGAENATTITCNITNKEGTQITTQWNLENFGNSAPGVLVSIVNVPELFKISGDPRPEGPGTYENQLTVLNLTRALDEVIVHCGSGANSTQANITLRIYRPPNLRDNFLVKLRENSENIPVDLRQEPLAFPEPTIPGSFMWTKDGQPLTGFDLTYSNVTFTRVRRADAGNYAVTATSYVGNTISTQQIGTDTGSFYLDVIYGPSFVSGSPTPTPIQRFVLLGNSVSLVCGRGLDSNPSATVTWTAPNSTEIMENDRYRLDNGPEVVRLNFTGTIMSDNGIWRCDVTVRSERHVLGTDGNLVLVAPEVIGTLTQGFLLTVIAQPNPPRSLGVENVGATWVLICWTPPIITESPISRYEVIARETDNDNASPVNISTANNTTTFINVTGLLPGTNYNFTVVAVVEGGEVVARSEESDPLGNIMTTTTVPEVVCHQPMSDNGTITVSWSYVHTGGLPLSNVSVQYTFQPGSSTVTETVSGVDTSDRMTKVRKLLAGEAYTFTVSAANRNGSSSDECPSVNHVVGVPAMPTFGTLTSGPQAGEITIEIKTVASGVDRVGHRFRFLITPVLGSTTQTVQPFDFFNYQSGDFVSITVGGLEKGRSYTFSATATNIFGTSDPASSPPQSAAGVGVIQPSQEPPSTGESASAGAIAGGVVGGLIVVVIAVVIVVIVVLLVTRTRDQSYKVEGGKYHKASTSDPNTVKIEEVPVATVDIGTDLQKSAPKEEHEIQYAELESFRPPSQQKNTANDVAPMQPEEPVEYAMITGFKKADEDTAPLDPTPAPAEDDPDKTGTSTTLV